uniref:Uncharacterized protein n=1 Tax=Nymphaea colorata TaxID=210225 RepID=A0A5K1HXW9_9MAGN|nr:unnamed protein product [Nymphaea colorata]
MKRVGHVIKLHIPTKAVELRSSLWGGEVFPQR